MQCGAPADVEHARVRAVNGTFQFKSQIEYACARGYVMVGRSRLTCDVDERWNGPPPR